MIGSFLLISIVVLAVAIVAMVLFSQTTPQKIPNVNFMVGTDNSGNLYLYHNGGDSLSVGQFDILVDNTPVTNYHISDGSTNWSLGNNIVVNGIPSGSHSVVLVYNNSGTGSIVLRSASANISTIPQNVRADIISLNFPPVIDIPQLVQNVTNRSVIFYREKNMTLTTPGTYLKFNVNQPNSTMGTPLCGINPFILNVGDNVSVTLAGASTQNMRVIGTGDELWELSADNVNLDIRDKNGVSRCSPASPGFINHTIITGYDHLQSTLSVSTASPQGSYYSSITINNYTGIATPQLTRQLINGINGDTLAVNGISPSPAGFFVFQFDNNPKSVYFAGNTTKIMRNGVQIYP